MPSTDKAEHCAVRQKNILQSSAQVPQSKAKKGGIGAKVNILMTGMNNNYVSQTWPVKHYVVSTLYSLRIDLSPRCQGTIPKP